MQTYGGWQGEDKFGKGNAVPRPLPGCGRFVAIEAARQPVKDEHWSSNQQRFKRLEDRRALFVHSLALYHDL